MNMDNTSYYIFGIVILILSVVVHEISHGYAALALGDPTAKHQGRLTLNPIKHLDLYGSFIVPLLLIIFHTGVIIGWAKPVPFNPYNLRSAKWGEAVVAAAGPIANIALAVVFGLIIRFISEYGFLNQPFLDLASFVVFINIALAIFNLIPIPPLDGSKILFAFLPYRWQNIRDSFEKFGLVLVLVFIFFLWQVMSPFINFLFTFLAGQPPF